MHQVWIKNTTYVKYRWCLRFRLRHKKDCIKLRCGGRRLSKASPESCLQKSLDPTELRQMFWYYELLSFKTDHWKRRWTVEGWDVRQTEKTDVSFTSVFHVSTRLKRGSEGHSFTSHWNLSYRTHRRKSLLHPYVTYECLRGLYSPDVQKPRGTFSSGVFWKPGRLILLHLSS